MGVEPSVAVRRRAGEDRVRLVRLDATCFSAAIAAAAVPAVFADDPPPAPDAAAARTGRAAGFDPVAAAGADRFGLGAARRPDTEVGVDLKRGECRKLKPGPAEEFVFLDRRSGCTRILPTMRRKAESLR